MAIAYIIGPYRNDDVLQRQANIDKASEIAKKYWQLGYAVICPHINSAHFDGICEDEILLKGYLEILGRLSADKGDIVVILPGWEYSQGAIKEIDLAEGMGLRRYYD